MLKRAAIASHENQTSYEGGNQLELVPERSEGGAGTDISGGQSLTEALGVERAPATLDNDVVPGDEKIRVVELGPAFQKRHWNEEQRETVNRDTLFGHALTHELEKRIEPSRARRFLRRL